MKKNFLLMPLILLVLSLTSCKSTDYDAAMKLYVNGDYGEAIIKFSELGDYEDSLMKVNECKYYLGLRAMEAENWDDAISNFSGISLNDSVDLLAICEKEKGMRDNDDLNFLRDLEEAILNRISDSKTVDYSIIVSTELAYVEKYYESQFYDSRLKELSKKYIDGLYLQQKALDFDYYSEYQVQWQNGMAERYESLKALYSEYDFLKDNKDFVGTYVYQCDNVRALADAYNELEADLGAQIEAKATDANAWYIHDNHLYTQFFNNTDYTYSITWDFKFVEQKNTQNILGSHSDSIENIMPGESYLVEIYIGDIIGQFTFWFSAYYDDVKF